MVGTGQASIARAGGPLWGGPIWGSPYGGRAATRNILAMPARHNHLATVAGLAPVLQACGLASRVLQLNAT